MEPFVPPPRAALRYANYAQFEPEFFWATPGVESRLLLLCRSGAGRVWVNDEPFHFESRLWMLLPWGASVAYQADERDPFMLAGLHTIPDCRETEPILEVSHQPGDALSGCPQRGDAPIPGLEGLVQGALWRNPALEPLCNYVLALFLRGELSDAQSRSLAAMLLEELHRCLHSEFSGGAPRPPLLHKLIRLVETNIDRPWSLSDLVEAGGRSPSTVNRLFRERLGTTATRWILQTKVSRAQEMLRTTRLPVAEVGRRVGLADPYYFSRVFKKIAGMSPSDWRNQNPLI